MPTTIILRSGAVSLAEAKLLRVQVVPIGARLQHPRYGELNFDREFAERLVENFKRYTGRVPLDYDHGTNAPENPEQGIAAGWIKALRIEQDAVIAYAEPTSRALGYVEAGEFALASPTIDMAFADPASGGEWGPTLLALALTNRPFIRGMEMASTVDAATVALRAPRKEHNVENEQVSANAEATPAPAEVVALAEHKQVLGTLEKQVLSLNETVVSLRSENAKLGEELAALRSERERAVALSEVEALEAAGKTTPAEREALVELRLSNAALFGKLTAARGQVVPLAARGMESGPQMSDPEARIEKRIAELRSSDPRLTKEQAYTLALRDVPEAFTASITKAQA